MDNLFLATALIAFFLGFMSLIAPKSVNRLIKKNYSRKRLLLIFGVAWFFSMSAFNSFTATPSSSGVQIVQQDEVVTALLDEAQVEEDKPGEYFEEDKLRAKKYYDEVLQIAEKGDTAYSIMQSYLDSGDLLGSYTQMTATMNALNGVESELRNYKGQIVFHDKSHEERFKEGIDAVQSSYQWKRWAIRDMKKYLDDNKPKDYESALNSIQYSQNDLMVGLAKLLEVEMAYGLLEEG